MTVTPAQMRLGAVLISTGEFGLIEHARHMVCQHEDGTLYVIAPDGQHGLADHVDVNGNYLGFDLDDPFADIPKAPPRLWMGSSR